MRSTIGQDVYRRETFSVPTRIFSIVFPFFGLLIGGAGLTSLVLRSERIPVAVLLAWLLFSCLTVGLIQYNRYFANRLIIGTEQLEYHYGMFGQIKVIPFQDIRTIDRVHTPDGLGYWTLTTAHEAIRIPESFRGAWGFLNNLRMRLRPEAGPIDGTYYGGYAHQNRYLVVALDLLVACVLITIPLIAPHDLAIAGFVLWAIFSAIFSLFTADLLRKRIVVKCGEIVRYNLTGDRVVSLSGEAVRQIEAQFVDRIDSVVTFEELDQAISSSRRAP